MRPSLAPYLLGAALLVSCTTEDGAFPGCPARGDAVTSGVHALNRLKNRVAAPENTTPGRVGNWRATAWELHPVTGVEVVDHSP